MGAPRIVCLHGAGYAGPCWGEVLAALADAEAPSLPGRAGDDAPLPDVAAMAAWVRDRVEGPYVVVGHSLGGAVAIELALARPPGLVGIVLVSTGARLRVRPEILALVEDAAATGRPSPMGEFAWHPGTDPARIETVEAIARGVPPGTTLADWRATHAFDRTSRLGEIDVPALVLVGADDLLTPPKYARFLAAGMARATLVEVAGAGHMLPFERPAEIAALVADFVRSIG